jgi:heat shock protein HslJ
MMNVGYWQHKALPVPPLLLKVELVLGVEGGISTMKSKIIATMVVVILGSWLLPGCKFLTEEVPMLGTRWNLDLLNDHPLIPNSIITAEFKEGERVDYLSGKTGCNWYSIPIALGRDQITYPDLPNTGLVVTDMGCEPTDWMEQENEFIETLLSITAYDISMGRLELKNQGGEVVLVFQKDPKEIDIALLGRNWRLETLKGQVMIPNSLITVTFRERMREDLFDVSGNAGCNGYSFVVELEKDQITYSNQVPSPGYIRISECAGLMEQEEEYIATLLSTSSYKVSDDRLELKNQAGEVVLVFRSGE